MEKYHFVKISSSTFSRTIFSNNVFDLDTIGDTRGSDPGSVAFWQEMGHLDNSIGTLIAALPTNQGPGSTPPSPRTLKTRRGGRQLDRSTALYIYKAENCKLVVVLNHAQKQNLYLNNV